MGLIGIANPVIGETLAFVIAYQLKRTVWPFVKNTVIDTTSNFYSKKKLEICLTVFVTRNDVITNNPQTRSDVTPILLEQTGEPTHTYTHSLKTFPAVDG